MSNVIPFDVEFDGTDMSVDQVREKARSKGWPGVHIDMDGLLATGTLMIRRLTRSAVYGDQRKP